MPESGDTEIKAVLSSRSPFWLRRYLARISTMAKIDVSCVLETHREGLMFVESAKASWELSVTVPVGL